MNKIRVAIVIVTYNSARLTIECLASIAEERGSADLDITAVVVDTSGRDLSDIQNAIASNN